MFKSLKRDGYYIHEALMTPKEAKRAREYCVGLFESYQRQLKYRPDLVCDMVDNDNKMWQISKRWNGRYELGLKPEQCPELCQNPRIMQVVRQIHPQYRLINAGCIVSQPEDPHTASDQPWHRDCHRDVIDYKKVAPRWLTLFIALEDTVDSSNGSPEFIVGSHVRPSRLRARWPDLTCEQEMLSYTPPIPFTVGKSMPVGNPGS